MEQVGRVPGRKSTKECADRQLVFRLHHRERGGNLRQGRQLATAESEQRPRLDEASFHSRKSHRKSRSGCQNCKKRRIKCDEIRPTCQKCARHGISCDYTYALNPKTNAGATLDSAREASDRYAEVNSWRSRAPFAMSISLAGSCVDSLLDSDASPLQVISHVQALHHFTTQAFSTIGGTLAQQVALQAVPQIATSYPYLMHAILGFAALHLKHLLPAASNPALHSQYTLSSSYHWSRALSLFQLILRDPSNITPGNMDAILSTCLFLNTMSMSLIDEPDSPSSSRSPSSSAAIEPTTFVHCSNAREASQALTWLYMQSGTTTLIHTFGCHLPQSVWLPVFEASDDENETYSDERCGRVGLPSTLADLFEITDRDTGETNPYHTLLRLIVPLLRLHLAQSSSRSRPFPSSSSTGSSFSSSSTSSSSSFSSSSTTPTEPPESPNLFTKLITFPGRIPPAFKSLLAERDPKALLLMGCWFGLAAGMDEWWVQARAVREGRAVCEFFSILCLHRRRQRQQQQRQRPRRWWEVEGETEIDGLEMSKTGSLLLRWIESRVGFQGEKQWGMDDGDGGEGGDGYGDDLEVLSEVELLSRILA